MAGDCTGDLDLFYFNLHIKWCGRLLCNAGLSACLYFDDFCCDYIYTDYGGTFSRHKEKNRSTRRQKIRIVTRSHVNSVNGSPDENSTSVFLIPVWTTGSIAECIRWQKSIREQIVYM